MSAKAPAWLVEVVEKWRASIAHVFILHGNVDDLVMPNTYVRDCLIGSGLLSKRECIICYNRSKGIYFPLATHRKVFQELVGLAEAPQTGALAALQQARGNTQQPDEVPLPRAPGEALPLIGRALTATDEEGRPKCALIIEYAETVIPDVDMAAASPDVQDILVNLLTWAREREYISAGPPIFLLAETLGGVHSSLRSASSRIEAIKVDLPGIESRRQFVDLLAQMHEVPVEDINQAAALTAGLKNVHIEDVILRARSEQLPLNTELIKARKNEILRQEFSDVLELMDPTFGFEAIGGMEHVKNFLRRNVIEPIKAGNLRRVPVGILFPGPPGTGKTVLAIAAAKESGINCVILNLSKIMDKWVGSSERAMERLLACLRALAPCLVIIDEIDQMGLSRDGDGTGVSNRLFKMLLEFMADGNNRGRVVFMGMTNRPDAMDAALKRPGRFDRKIPVLPPDEGERKEIIGIICSKYSITCNADTTAVAKATEGYTGAELEALVLKAYEVAEDNGKEAVDDEAFGYALEVYVPTTGDILQQTQLALQECNDKDLVPPAYRSLLEQRRETRGLAADGPRTVRSL